MATPEEYAGGTPSSSSTIATWDEGRVTVTGTRAQSQPRPGDARREDGEDAHVPVRRDRVEPCARTAAGECQLDRQHPEQAEARPPTPAMGLLEDVVGSRPHRRGAARSHDGQHHGDRDSEGDG